MDEHNSHEELNNILEESRQTLGSLHNYSSTIKRIPTVVDGFDSQMEGGIPEASITLLCGTSGTMKSSVSFNILYHYVLQGNKGIYISLEQSYASLLSQMMRMGFDMSKMHTILISEVSDLMGTLKKVRNLEGGVLIVADLGAIREEITHLESHPLNSGSHWTMLIENILKTMHSDRESTMFILDSLAAFYTLSSFNEPRKDIFQIFNFLRKYNVTSILLSEMSKDSNKYGVYEVEDFLADNIIHLNLQRRDLRVLREISVVKMRNTSCSTDVFLLNFEHNRFHALKKMG